MTDTDSSIQGSAPNEGLETPAAAIDNSAEEDLKEPKLIRALFGWLAWSRRGLSTDSLKALRLTCKAFRDLVDRATGRLQPILQADSGKSSKFELCLQAWAFGTRLTKLTRSICITGNVDRVLSGYLLVALSTQKPPISKMVLDNVRSGKLLLTAPMNELRELSVIETCMADAIAKNPSLVGLRSLQIHCKGATEAAALAAMLTHCSQLRSLDLKDIDAVGDVPPLEALRGALPHLESLELACCNVEKVGLLAVGGPTLPALRSLKLETMEFEELNNCWLRQLSSLSLITVKTNGIVEALNGGPLAELVLDLGYSNDAYANWKWTELELTNLTRLQLSSYSADALGDAAHARMPLLQSADLPFDQYTTVDGTLAFANAFQHLRMLSLRRRTRYGPPCGAVRALSQDIVPRLETLVCGFSSSEFVSILPPGSAETEPVWPRLCHLSFQDYVYGFPTIIDPAKEWLDFVLSVTRAAPHFPSLITLELSIGHASRKELNRFLDVAREVHAWPLLRMLQITPFETETFKKEAGDLWPLLGKEVGRLQR